MACFVCEEMIAVQDLHHVIPQSRGGTEGPTVPLCPNCHAIIHSAAYAMIAGKVPDAFIDHLDHDARGRAMILIKSIAIVEATKEDKRNPHPLLSVALDHHSYHVALTLLQKDRGFSSRDKLINALCREIAKQYGLIGSLDAIDASPVLVPLSKFRNK